MPTIVVASFGWPRRLPPPLPHDGGGFWYVRRRDGAVLLNADGDYVRFDDAVSAQSHIDLFIGEGEPRWMPKMRTN